MKWKVCIPVAGLGRRLGSQTRSLHKALVAVKGKPVLAHILEKFPRRVSCVVLLGYRGDQVREFLRLCYPRRRFEFVRVTPFEGPGSGLGRSLWCARRRLQCPFVFVSCDTLVRGKIPPPRKNWAGYSRRPSNGAYRSLVVRRGRVQDLVEKGKQPRQGRPYIGLAAIRNHRAFWRAMKPGPSTWKKGEVQGLRALLPGIVQAKAFDWYDTGNPQALALTRKRWGNHGLPSILEKPGEAIWFVQDRVVKFSTDPSFISRRIRRARLLRPYVPTVLDHGQQMYTYRRVAGRVFSDVSNLPLFRRLLAHCNSFWKSAPLAPAAWRRFRQACFSFYRDKSFERVEEFYRRFDLRDRPRRINGRPVPPLADLLEAVPWEWLAEGRPVRYHGDLHFENIVLDPGRKFVFLDWRQDFGGSLRVGDWYYDLAKLWHGMVVSHRVVSAGRYGVRFGSSRASFWLARPRILSDCEEYFLRWLDQHPSGLSRRKTKILTSLIFINIAPLHHHPYALLLYCLGTEWLHDCLGGKS